MPAPYVVEEYVRWSDVDFAGIIFYGSYVRFFEIAETELFRPARLDDRLRVATYVARLGTKSLTLNFDVLHTDGPKLSAAGWQVLVCVDRPRLKSRPLPAELVRALAPYTLATDAARAALG